MSFIIINSSIYTVIIVNILADLTGFLMEFLLKLLLYAFWVSAAGCCDEIRKELS